MALTDRQKKFADEYLIDLNASAAYLRAGYKCSEAAARSSSSELLTNPNIQEYIESKQRKIEERTELTAEWVLRELAENHRIAREIGELPASNKALELIGKHKGMFKDKVELSGSVSVETLLEQIS